MSHVNEPPPPLGDDVPDDIRTVVEALLQKDPDDRPENAASVAVMLGVAPLEVTGLDLGEASDVPSGYLSMPLTPMTPARPLTAPADRQQADVPTMAAGPEQLLD